MEIWSIPPQYFFCGYCFLMSGIGWLQMYIDKSRSIQHRWRISERSLMMTALLGGAVGIWLGMYTVHHKTRKPLFIIMIPGLSFFQTLFLIYILIS